MKRGRNRLDSSLTLLSRDDPEMDLHGYRGTMLRQRRSKNFPQRRYSPSFLSLNAHYGDACTAIHSSTWLLIESIDIVRYTRTSFLGTIFTGARSLVYWSIECYCTWMLLKSSYYVSINSWNDLILETKTKTKVESKVALRFVYWLFRFRFALDEGEREFKENETKRN